MYFVPPNGGERFYLRMLLTHVRSATSYDDLRSFEGITYETFKLACIARGLLDSDEQWDRSVQEAAGCQTSSQLRDCLSAFYFIVNLPTLYNCRRITLHRYQTIARSDYEPVIISSIHLKIR
jgi:hypothetical protein